MLAKLTSKNQLTLPKAVVQAVMPSPGVVEYFDVQAQGGQIVLTPVRVQRGDAVRAKLAELGIEPADVADAVAWARGQQVPGNQGTVPTVQEPAALYAVEAASQSAPSTTPKRKSSRRRA
jgi:hypothetical protein